jgi:hypothetical protein
MDEKVRCHSVLVGSNIGRGCANCLRIKTKFFDQSTVVCPVFSPLSLRKPHYQQPSSVIFIHVSHWNYLFVSTIQLTSNTSVPSGDQN